MAAHLYLLGHLGNPCQVTSQNGCQSIFTWPLHSSHSLIAQNGCSSVFTWLLGQSLSSNLSKWLPIHIYLATKLQSLLDSIQTCQSAQNSCHYWSCMHKTVGVAINLLVYNSNFPPSSGNMHAEKGNFDFRPASNLFRSIQLLCVI